MLLKKNMSNNNYVFYVLGAWSEVLDLLHTMALRVEEQGSYQTVVKKFWKVSASYKEKKKGDKTFSHNIFETFSIKQAISEELVDPICSDGYGAQRYQPEKKKNYKLLMYV